MSDIDRRHFLKGVLSSLVQTAGTVIVASAAVSAARAQGNDAEGADPPPEDVQEAADRLAAANVAEAEAAAEPNEFRNGAFLNTPLGAFRNGAPGGFRNRPQGSFRNAPVGGFRNTPWGAFGNGGWSNGGWGGFRNGGWPNGAWMNWW